MEGGRAIFEKFYGALPFSKIRVGTDLENPVAHHPMNGVEGQETLLCILNLSIYEKALQNVVVVGFWSVIRVRNKFEQNKR